MLFIIVFSVVVCMIAYLASNGAKNRKRKSEIEEKAELGELPTEWLPDIPIDCKDGVVLTANDSGVIIKTPDSEKILLFSNIVAIEIMETSGMVDSYRKLVFSTPMANDSSLRLGYGISISSGSKIILEYYSAENHLVDGFRNYILSKISPVNTIKSNESVSDQIRELANLLNDGLITQDEFDAKKRQILDL